MKNKIIKNHLFSKCLLTFILLFCFILQLSVQGVVYVNKNAIGANNGNSWADAYTTIQAGINDADVADEEVWVAQGTYPEAITMKSGVKLYGGFNGTETELNQRNWTTNVTTIDGSTARGGLPTYHVVIMHSITFSIIDGFTITGGNADSEGTNGYGGGIFCYNCNDTNTIENNTIKGNSAVQGGGIYCRSSSLSIRNNAFSQNSAYDGGGGIYFESSLPYLTVKNNIFSWNSATNGGGLHCANSSPQITNNIILRNTASTWGGGIHCGSSSPQITDNIISGNSGYSGGGISCELGSSPSILNNTISGNSAYWSGGGVYCGNSSSPVITNNNISGNSANINGGGIFCNDASPAITNNTISRNSASTNGGGFFCDSSSPYIKNNIFINNSQYDIYEPDINSDPIVSYNNFFGNLDGIYYDEGLFAYTSVSAMDSAIAECSNNIGLNPLFVGDTLSGGNWTADAIYNSATFQTTLTNSSAIWTPNEHAGRLLNPDTTHNKQFVIVSNTATTMTVWSDVTTITQNGDAYKIFDYHLQLASPCIDAGYDQDVPDIDFDGEPRPMDVLGIDNNGPLAEYDIGADEYPGVTTTLAATVWEFYQ